MSSRSILIKGNLFVIGRVDPAHNGVLQENERGGRVYLMTAYDFVLAVNDTVQHWFEKNPTLREDILPIMRAVKLEETMTESDKTEATIPFRLTTGSSAGQAAFLQEGCSIKWGATGIEVLLPLEGIFIHAALHHLEQNPRLPVIGLGGLTAKQIRDRWDNALFEAEQKTRPRKRA